MSASDIKDVYLRPLLGEEIRGGCVQTPIFWILMVHEPLILIQAMQSLIACQFTRSHCGLSPCSNFPEREDFHHLRDHCQFSSSPPPVSFISFILLQPYMATVSFRINTWIGALVIALDGAFRWSIRWSIRQKISLYHLVS